MGFKAVLFGPLLEETEALDSKGSKAGVPKEMLRSEDSCRKEVLCFWNYTRWTRAKQAELPRNFWMCLFEGHRKKNEKRNWQSVSNSRKSTKSVLLKATDLADLAESFKRPLVVCLQALRFYYHAKWLAERNHATAAEWRYREAGSKLILTVFF